MMNGYILELVGSEESVSFQNKKISLNPNKPVGLGRSTKGRPATADNALFNSRVLSKEHGVLSFKNDAFFIQDAGSSNGTFLNNVRLSKSGELSEPTRIYSHDVLRFGVPGVDKEKGETFKSVVATVTLHLPSIGESESGRPAADRITPKSCVQPKKRRKQVKFDENEMDDEERDDCNDKEKKEKDEEKDKEKKEKDEKKEKEEKKADAHVQNDSSEKENIKDAVDSFGNERVRSVVEGLEKRLRRKGSEVKNLTDNLNQLRAEKEALEREVNRFKDEMETQLREVKRSKEEMEAQGKALRRSKEDSEVELEKTRMKNQDLADQLAVKIKEEIENIRIVDLESELEEAKGLARKCIEENWILKEKLRVDNQHSNRQELEINELKSNLQHLQTGNQANLTTVENELVVTKKELEVSRNTIEAQRTEISGLTDLVTRADDILKEKDVDYLSLKHCMTEENETVHQIESEMVRLIQIIQAEQRSNKLKDEIIAGNTEEVNSFKEQIKTTNQQLENFKKTSDTNLEFALRKKNKELETLKNEVEKCRTAEEESRGINLEQTIHLQDLHHKQTQIQNLRKDYECLQLENKKDKAEIEDLLSQNKQFRSEYIEGVSYSTLTERLNREQEQNKELEEELIKLRVQVNTVNLDGLVAGVAEASSGNSAGAEYSDENMLILLQQKAAEIIQLKTAIHCEQEVVAHVQMTQEREILSKEEEIRTLRSQLEDERNNRKSVCSYDDPHNVTDDKSNDDYEDDDTTLSFHDALSDDEEIKYRCTGIDDLSLG